jgi:Ser/Thr protein kinase RdoA (MazF antagonist)
MAHRRTADEEPLAGGNVSHGVVKVGDTVRRPAMPWTPAVDALLRHLERNGFAHAPRCLGRDDAGRQVLAWVPGRTQYELGPMDNTQLKRIGRIIRRLHDVSAGFREPEGARWNVVIEPDRRDLVVHHDLAPWNLVVDGDRMTFIDWDGAGPGSRLWDLAYAAHGFSAASNESDPAFVGRRIASLVNGYGLGQEGRRRLVPMLAVRARAMYDLLDDGHRTGTQPWARMYDEGHANHWGPVSDYLRRHEREWASALGV